jgi:hypothetical protein
MLHITENEIIRGKPKGTVDKEGFIYLKDAQVFVVLNEKKSLLEIAIDIARGYPTPQDIVDANEAGLNIVDGVFSGPIKTLGLLLSSIKFCIEE